MRIGVADARRRFREILDRVGAGEVVEISRRNEVVAVVAPPSGPDRSDKPFDAALRAWRTEWAVESWPDDDPFADVRDRATGRVPPW